VCPGKAEGEGGEEEAYNVDTLFDDIVQDILDNAVGNRGLLLESGRLGHAFPYSENSQ
jgi:hypothetical protein